MRLETRRLILRDFEPDDWVATQRYESDPEVVRYQSFDVMTPEMSRNYIRRCLEDAASPFRHTYDLAVVKREDNDLIGRVGLLVSNSELREGTLWYVYRRDQWGQGFGTEAARAMLDLAFVQLKLRRVIADTDPANTGSIRVLQKIGFRQEAHHLRNQFLKGRWCDTLSFAILAEEFQPG